MIPIVKADGSSELELLGEIERRSEKTNRDVTAAVSEILENVRENGDRAVREYTIKFDGKAPDKTEITHEEMEALAKGCDPDFLKAVAHAAENISDFHKRQLRQSFFTTKEDNVILGQRVRGLERVGIYVPGGTASLPSTVLMNVIPAKLAGCGNIVMATPPGKDGRVSDAILAAADVAGVDRVFTVGGAQAIAALTYGTESIPRVDKIAGPGNAFVAEAKRQVYGAVSIDMIAGPSEILIIADGKNSPRNIAADMLSQAEHDRMASAVLITTSETLAKETAVELERQLSTLPREAVARVSIENNGKIIIVDTINTAADIANEIAPEHLELCVDEPFDILDKIKNAGSVFMGRFCPEALGDYLSGTNHTLPTGGTARFSSPLSVDDFVKKMQFTYYTKEALGGVYRDVAYFARAEGLEGHARSAETRFAEEKI